MDISGANIPELYKMLLWVMICSHRTNVPQFNAEQAVKESENTNRYIPEAGILCMRFKEMKEMRDHNMKIWVDDLRPIPAGYEGTRSVNETIALIEETEKKGEPIELIDLDHDLGDYAMDGGDAIKILDYLVERETFYPISIHTANPVGRANMERIIERFWE